VKTASALSDAISGVFAANGIVAALLHRERTGEGQAIDVAMSDCLFSLIFDEPIDCYEGLNLAPRQGNRIMRFSPFNVFQTKDGWVAIGAATHSEWLDLLDAMGRADVKADANMMDIGWRIVNNSAVDAVVTGWTSTRTNDEVVKALSVAGVACSPVRSTGEVMRWDQLLEREMIVRLVNPLTGAASAASAPGFPIKFSRTPAAYDTPAPIPGAHTDEVFARLAGLSPSELERLKTTGVI
jgi:formyl-CoA transferase